MAKPFVFNVVRDITPPGDLWGTARHIDEDEDPAARAEELLAWPRKAEELGLDGFSVGDHFYDSPDALIDCMASAAATNRIKVTQTVLCNDFRNPALLAKMISSIDVFSAGRAEVGIGAGYNEVEYRQAGYEFDSNPVRVERLREAVQILKALMESDKPVTFKGEYYTIDGLMGLPRPVQKPHPPIRMGGGGKKILKIAAEFADIVDIMTLGTYESGLSKDPWQYTKQSVLDKVEHVKEHAGSRADAIRFALVVLKFLLRDNRENGAREVHAEMDAAYRMHGHEDGFPLSTDDVLNSPYFLIGNEDEIVDHMLMLRRELGITEFLVFPGFIDEMKPVIDKARAAQ